MPIDPSAFPFAVFLDNKGRSGGRDTHGFHRFTSGSLSHSYAAGLVQVRGPRTLPVSSHLLHSVAARPLLPLPPLSLWTLSLGGALPGPASLPGYLQTQRFYSVFRSVYRELVFCLNSLRWVRKLESAWQGTPRDMPGSSAPFLRRC